MLMSPRPNRIMIQGISAPGVPPGLVPVLARGIDDAAVGLEELVGDLEDRKHQPALGTPRDVAAAWLAPDEFAGLGLAAGEAGLLPLHAVRANQVGMAIGGLRVLRRRSVHGDAPFH